MSTVTESQDTTSRFRVDPDAPKSTVIVESVAEVKGVDPTDLNHSLYDCLDPDALDQLYARNTSETAPTLSFSFAECEITVLGDDTIQVRLTTPNASR